jgi:hypothetical protein
MEDLIYIIIGVLWLVFTFYTASKKKKQQQQKTASKPTESSQPTTQPNILDEIFGEDTSVVFDDFPEEEQETEVNFTFEDEYEDKGIQSVETFGNKYFSDTENVSFKDLVRRAQEERIEEADTVDLHIEDEDDGIIKKDFNLRKALIYQAILERPYE